MYVCGLTVVVDALMVLIQGGKHHSLQIPYRPTYREREKAIEGGHIIVRSNTYLPPVRVILIDYLQYVSFLEGNAQAFTGNLIVTMTIIVEMSTHIFLVSIIDIILLCNYLPTRRRR